MNKKNMRIIPLLFLYLIFFISPSRASELHLSSLDTFRTSQNVELKTVKQKQYINDYSEIPLYLDEPITSISISVHGNLFNKRSYVRFILRDNGNNEHLIFEVAHPFYEKEFSLYLACNETCNIREIKPVSILIESEGTSVMIDEIAYSKETARSTEEITSLRRSQMSSKISLLNGIIEEKNLGWIAGETPISNMSYQEKKEFFGGRVPNLMGFEYYKGGVFRLPANEEVSSLDTPELVPEIPDIPESYDWRDVNGVNYMTPVKFQVGGTCWAYSAAGVYEANVNAHFNQNIDLDLSEQDTICRNPNSCVVGGLPTWTFSELRNYGLVDEECYPTALPCDNDCLTLEYCADRDERLWFLDTYRGFSNSEYSINSNVIREGPLNFAILSWAHSLVVVGYEPSESGETVWILKNSWGQYWGENGYARMVVPQYDRGYIYSVERPYFVNESQYEIHCQDLDSDNYCYWGVSEQMPESCPATCEPQLDCNDLDSNSFFYGASEICDDLDNNCNGLIDEGDVCGVQCPLEIPQFPDVPADHWASDYITNITCLGIATGYGDGTYKPSREVNRAQMAVFIVRTLHGENFEYSTTPYFPDVPADHWAFKYIQKMYEDGIAIGYRDGTYRPYNDVNRAQIAVFIVRTLHGDDFSYSNTPYFPDVSATRWAFKYIQKMYEDGISKGYADGTYKPSREVNRAQMAVFIDRAFL
jgi:C1A family cysteine protease